MKLFSRAFHFLSAHTLFVFYAEKARVSARFSG